MPKRKMSPTVVYDEVYSEVGRLNAEVSEELLGWTEDTDSKMYVSGEVILRDLHGKKICCSNNTKNRPIYPQKCIEYKHTILRGAWEFNGEPIIIGMHGSLLDGQHSLIAVKLATQEWEKNPDIWENWDEPPYIEKIVTYGISEEDKVVNTINTGRPRTLADVIFRSEYFEGMKRKDRQSVSRICSHAVQLLWERTGAKDAFSPFRTHMESCGFMERHPRVLEAVQYVWIENGGDNGLGRYLSLGYAAGMMYLMGCSGTDPGDYLESPGPDESGLDFSNWEKAEEFFTLLSSGSNVMRNTKLTLAKMLNGGIVSVEERKALLAKSWLQWMRRGKVTNVELKYELRGDERVLSEQPSVGGIDLLDKKDLEV